MNYILIRKRKVLPCPQQTLNRGLAYTIWALHLLSNLTVHSSLPTKHTKHCPHPRAFASALPITDKALYTLSSGFAQLSLLSEAFLGLAVPSAPCLTPIYFSLQPPSLTSYILFFFFFLRLIYFTCFLSSSPTRMKAPRGQGS